MKRHTWTVLPVTTLGKWSVALIVAVPVLVLIGTATVETLYQSVPAGRTISADIVARPALALPMLAAAACGFSAFMTGLLAIIRRKERAVTVYVSVAIGALIVLFIALEIIFPH